MSEAVRLMAARAAALADFDAAVEASARAYKEMGAAEKKVDDAHEALLEFLRTAAGVERSPGEHDPTDRWSFTRRAW